ncbi:polysaccharide deacetylase [Candidatus Magnetobacterium bavaricum]|uniref:Polysaccharide deacetylase n=1 Tax=Candidatus Magnetobacterium bavaricum TaxID=29290 RepID=A0A0F3GTH1_9BACT|nr:polysaccharide deacetylase [Candidatus Magnetobacterium bavaricum]
MTRLLTILQWIVFAALFVLIIIGANRKFPPLDYDKRHWHSWNGFSVISYAGITTKGKAGYVTPKQLSQQLEALHKAGYKTITPQDARDFLDGEFPLPEKAIMIVFEGIRKDNFLYATPLLKKYGMQATLCLPTGLINTYGSFYIQDSDIKKLTSMEHWNLCSMGHDAINDIVVDKNATKGHFLSRRLWSANGAENDAAFKARLENDYKKAEDLLKSLSGVPINAYLYPSSDSGNRELSDAGAAEINLTTVAKYHELAFTNTDKPFNSQLGTPYNVGRLNVINSMDAKQLLAYLQKLLPQRRHIEGVAASNFSFRGDNPEGDVTRLSLTDKATALVNGVEDWTNVDVSVTIKLTTKATFALYVRYRGNDSFLRLSLSEGGILLQEHDSTDAHSIMRHTNPIEVGNNHVLRLLVKGKRAWVWHNGVQINSPVPVSASVTSGMIGLESRGSSTLVKAFAAKKIMPLYVMTGDTNQLPKDVTEGMTAIMPSWFSIGQERVSLTEEQRNIMLKAASEGIATIPTLNGVQGLNQGDSEKLAANFLSLLDSERLLKPLITDVAMTGYNTWITDILHKRGVKVINVLPPTSVSCGAKKEMGDMIAVVGPPADVEGVINGMLWCLAPKYIVATLGQESKLTDDIGIVQTHDIGRK